MLHFSREGINEFYLKFVSQLQLSPPSSLYNLSNHKPLRNKPLFASINARIHPSLAFSDWPENGTLGIGKAKIFDRIRTGDICRFNCQRRCPGRSNSRLMVLFWMVYPERSCFSTLCYQAFQSSLLLASLGIF